MNTKDLIPIAQFCEIYKIEFSFINSLNDFGLIELTYVDKDEFIAGCEKAVDRYKSNPVNKEGISLQDKFSYSNTVDKIMEVINA